MADLTRTYSGPLARGRIDLNGRPVRFRRGVPLTVTKAEAELLDDDWATAKPSKPKAAKADKTDPSSDGDEPTAPADTPKES